MKRMTGGWPNLLKPREKVTSPATMSLRQIMLRHKVSREKSESDKWHTVKSTNFGALCKNHTHAEYRHLMVALREFDSG